MTRSRLVMSLPQPAGQNNILNILYFKALWPVYVSGELMPVNCETFFIR